MHCRCKPACPVEAQGSLVEQLKQKRLNQEMMSIAFIECAWCKTRACAPEMHRLQHHEPLGEAGSSECSALQDPQSAHPEHVPSPLISRLQESGSATELI